MYMFLSCIFTDVLVIALNGNLTFILCWYVYLIWIKHLQTNRIYFHDFLDVIDKMSIFQMKGFIIE